MEFVDYLYAETIDIWDALYKHPFITGLATGTLPIEKFRYYLAEDYQYLWENVKIFAVAITKTSDKKIIKKYTDLLNQCINYEMDIHKNLMQDFGCDINRIDEKRPNLTNRSYSNFRLSQALVGGYEEILIILMACDWSYVEIFKKLNERYPEAIENDLYGDLIKGYLNSRWLDYIYDALDEINKIGQNLSASKRESLLELFRSCLTYELKFWDMVYNEGDIF